MAARTLSCSSSRRFSHSAGCGPLQMRLGFFGECKKVSGVMTPHLFGLAACLQTIECVFTDDFQHPKAHLAAGLRFCHKQALIH